jgi:tetratricopeptide (TPR) repeat protein
MSRTTSEEPAATLGARVRTLRGAAGMTQVELAAGRFSKQYVSQIERGEVVPTGEVLEWLAERLGAEVVQLETGLAAADLERLEDDLRRGQSLLDTHRYAEALETFRPLRESLGPGAPRSIQREAMRGETWALLSLGRVTEAAEVIGEDRLIADGPFGTREEQAELAFLTAVCCYMISQIPAAHGEFARAIQLLDEADQPNDRLRLDIHRWRSRCYRRQRDWEAAREDIDRALELCEATGDLRRTAEVAFQASLVDYRLGRWILARRHAETSLALLEDLDDPVTKARVLNNLANLNHLLAATDVAIGQLQEAFSIFVDAQLEAEAGYVLSSLAEIRRESGELEEAERTARQASELLDGRVDHVQEIGMAKLVLARVRLEHGDLDEAESILTEVDESFEQAQSISHQARSWMTRGELELKRQNDTEAARLYREAAVALEQIDLE